MKESTFLSFWKKRIYGQLLNECTDFKISFSYVLTSPKYIHLRNFRTVTAYLQNLGNFYFLNFI